MARLPPIDTHAHWIRDALHRGDREEAVKRILERLATGKACAETQQIAAEIFGAKKGRPKYGSKYRWPDIGQDNEEMIAAGLSEAERQKKLALKSNE